MKLRKVMALTMAGAMVATTLTACGSSSSKTETTAAADATTAAADAAAPEGTVVINVGYENATTEPAAKAVEKWKELVEEKSNGSIELKLFPNSALGKKTCSRSSAAADSCRVYGCFNMASTAS